MNDWIFILTVGAVLLGLVAGIILYARSPSFWINVALYLEPIILKLVLKRMPPEEEAQWRDLQARGASKEEIMAWERQRIIKRRLNKGK